MMWSGKSREVYSCLLRLARRRHWNSRVLGVFSSCQNWIVDNAQKSSTPISVEFRKSFRGPRVGGWVGCINFKWRSCEGSFGPGAGLADSMGKCGRGECDQESGLVNSLVYRIRNCFIHSEGSFESGALHSLRPISFALIHSFAGIFNSARFIRIRMKNCA